MKHKIVLLFAMLSISIGIFTIISTGFIYWAFHPELTQMQIFLTNWHWFMIGVVLTCSGMWLYHSVE